MNKTKKATLYYILFGFCTIGVIVNIVEHTWIPILLWLPLAVVFGILLKRRLKSINVEKSVLQADNEKLLKALNAYRDEYLKVISDSSSLGEIKIDSLTINSTIGISEKDASMVEEQVRKECLDKIVSQSICDGILSPKDYDNIITSAQRLNVKLSFDTNTSAYLEKLKKYWIIENEDLQILDVHISLQKNEVCHFQTDCRWLEQRTITKSIAYTGITGSFKIAKGVRYRVGNIKPKRITTESLVEIDNGQLFITNQRLIFMGTKKNTNIKYQNVLSVVPYSDGIGIEKDSGKSPTLIFNNADIAVRILSRLND